jgi:PAS domain S-box-containing protein
MPLLALLTLDCEPAASGAHFPVEGKLTEDLVSDSEVETTAGLRSLGHVWRALAGLRRPRHSVSGRMMLVVLLTTVVALLVAGTALLVTDLRDSRQAWADDVATEAGILALSVAPAMSFDDRAAASRSLNALQAKPSIAIAALYSPRGDIYAYYVRSDDGSLPARLPNLGTEVHVNGDRVELLRPIVQNDERLGTIYLKANYDVAQRIRSYASVLILVMMLSLIVALIVSIQFQRVITQPLKSIANVAHEVVGGRDYSLRAEKTTDDELGVVVDAFNRMLDEIQGRTRALEESEKLYRAIGESIQYGVWLGAADGRNIYASDSFLKLTGLTQEQCSEHGWASVLHPEDRDNTLAAWAECVRTGGNWYREHRVRGTDGRYHPILAQGVPIRNDDGQITRWAGINLDIGRLKHTEQALIDADRRKDEFLATLAHELRNPLAPIRNAVRILEMPATDEQQRRWGREVIARQVRNMALLLDDLLDVSRITRGKLELKKEYVGLRNVVEVAVETARPLIEGKQHTLTVALPSEEITLEGDPLRLSQVIANLLTNASKYTDPGGRIELTTSIGQAWFSISVKDSGIGLAPETISGLFEMFSQVNTAIDRTQGGLGIGLGLVKGLVTLHGGSVEARSEGLGRGSEFIVNLPLSMIRTKGERSEARRGPLEVLVPRAPARILVADDNREAAESLAALLSLAGYQVTSVFSGPQALEAAARERPNVLLLDIGMPGMSGYEVARRIRLEAWGREVLLIAITGWGQQADKLQAQASGFNAHMTKPVDPREIERMLVEFLASAARGERSSVQPQQT